eukprot:438186-Hanusia_phi.AAC.2
MEPRGGTPPGPPFPVPGARWPGWSGVFNHRIIGFNLANRKVRVHRRPRAEIPIGFEGTPEMTRSGTPHWAHSGPARRAYNYPHESTTGLYKKLKNPIEAMVKESNHRKSPRIRARPGSDDPAGRTGSDRRRTVP